MSRERAIGCELLIRGTPIMSNWFTTARPCSVIEAPIRDATGWEPVWGPARLEDLPAFLDRGLATHKQERAMRFPLWERLEMA